jgi:hypothetical protein
MAEDGEVETMVSTLDEGSLDACLSEFDGAPLEEVRAELAEVLKDPGRYGCAYPLGSGIMLNCGILR